MAESTVAAVYDRRYFVDSRKSLMALRATPDDETSSVQVEAGAFDPPAGSSIFPESGSFAVAEESPTCDSVSRQTALTERRYSCSIRVFQQPAGLDDRSRKG